MNPKKIMNLLETMVLLSKSPKNGINYATLVHKGLNESTQELISKGYLKEDGQGAQKYIFLTDEGKQYIEEVSGFAEEAFY